MAVKKYQDNFDKREVDLDKWICKQRSNGVIDFPNTSQRSNSNSCIRILVNKSTERQVNSDSNETFQRSELRTAEKWRPKYYEEFWHAFSFKIEGNVPPVGSSRIVIGQWKFPGDDSPSIAQRFDNGVFHISIQNDVNRIYVASSSNYDFDDDKKDVLEELPKLPDPTNEWVRMAYRIKQARDDNPWPLPNRGLGELDIYANGKLVVSYRGNYGYQLTESDFKDESVYFKFGVYRRAVDTPLAMLLDDFRQGSAFNDIK